MWLKTWCGREVIHSSILIIFHMFICASMCTHVYLHEDQRPAGSRQFPSWEWSSGHQPAAGILWARPFRQPNSDYWFCCFCCLYYHFPLFRSGEWLNQSSYGPACDQIRSRTQAFPLLVYCFLIVHLKSFSEQQFSHLPQPVSSVWPTHI